MKHKLKSRLLDSEEMESQWKQCPVVDMIGRNISNLSYADDTTLMAESEEELKSLLMRMEEKSEKAGLKLSIQKTKIMASRPYLPLHGK